MTISVAGNPTPEELAVVLAVVASSGSVAEEPEPPVRSRWAERSAMLRGPFPHGPGAWQATSLR